VRKRKGEQDQHQLEKQKEQLETKLENAAHKREQNLEQIKNVAQLSAKKKLSFVNITANDTTD
jgi:hypothetical protein